MLYLAVAMLGKNGKQCVSPEAVLLTEEIAHEMVLPRRKTHYFPARTAAGLMLGRLLEEMLQDCAAAAPR